MDESFLSFPQTPKGKYMGGELKQSGVHMLCTDCGMKPRIKTEHYCPECKKARKERVEAHAKRIQREQPLP